MPRRRKKLTPNQQLYKKQITRIKRAIRRSESQGFTIPYNIIPETPKRITAKSISALKSITPASIRASAVEYTNPFTGEIFSKAPKNYSQIAKEYYAQSSSSPVASRRELSINIIDNYRDYISGYKYHTKRGKINTDIYDMVNNWLNNLISQKGEKEVAQMLNTGYQKGQWLSPSEAYDELMLTKSLYTMMKYLGMDDSEISSFNTLLE